MKKRRIAYGLTFFLLTVTEVLIGMFVHDSFVRPYLGDVIIVIVLYSFVRIFMPENFTYLPAVIFIFAVGVELLQGLNIADRLGIQSQLLRTIIGTVCDIRDIYCYAAGCILIGIYEIVRHFYRKGKTQDEK